MRDRLNTIKGRELWRPLAPIGTAGADERFWEGPRQLQRYMLGAARRDAAGRERIAATVHVDGTARAQIADGAGFVCDVLTALGKAGARTRTRSTPPSTPAASRSCNTADERSEARRQSVSISSSSATSSSFARERATEIISRAMDRIDRTLFPEAIVGDRPMAARGHEQGDRCSHRVPRPVHPAPCGGQRRQRTPESPGAEYTSLNYPEFDLCAPIVGQRKFDVVICEQVMEHVADPWAAAANLRKLTEPGGHVIVSTPFLIKVHEIALVGMHDYWRFTPRGLAGAAGERRARGRHGGDLGESAVRDRKPSALALLPSLAPTSQRPGSRRAGLGVRAQSPLRQAGGPSVPLRQSELPRKRQGLAEPVVGVLVSAARQSADQPSHWRARWRPAGREPCTSCAGAIAALGGQGPRCRRRSGAGARRSPQPPASAARSISAGPDAGHLPIDREDADRFGLAGPRARSRDRARRARRCAAATRACRRPPRSARAPRRAAARAGRSSRPGRRAARSRQERNQSAERSSRCGLAARTSSSRPEKRPWNRPATARHRSQTDISPTCQSSTPGTFSSSSQ